MNDRELEDLMRDYEAEVAAYKRLPQSEPTALLDRAVLTKARAAVGHTYRPPRWIALAASFAGVAIAAGIGWRVYEAQESARGEAMLDGARAREETFEVEVLPSSSRDRAKALEMAQLPPPPPAKPEPQAFNEAKSEQQSQPAAEEVVLADRAEPTASEALSAAAAPAPQRRGAIEADKRADHATRSAMPEQRQNLAAPATPAPAAPVIALGSAAEDAKDASSERIDADQESGAGRAQEKQDLHARDEWLERIRRLVRERRHSEARAELLRFRAAYPDAVIPPDLRRFQP